MIKQSKFSNGASSKYKLILGLGNSGKDYEHSYHNAGFLFLDSLLGELKLKRVKSFAYAKIDGATIVKPLTFMNESGKAVKQAIKYFRLQPEEIVIVHDDSDVQLGKYKLSISRGSAGHRGVESIIKSLGTKNFARLRIGIRSEANPPSLKLRRARAGDFVLKKISKRDYMLLNSAFEKIAKEINLNDFE
ncbi:MAG: hypothetical protein AUJ39_01480 [Parcubacteria group bacterium CG1_02_42_13]|nr:MAG: hypothetical protein AUJ39_01480 [Parcubacteria group bacterium CG1_02_42_13]